jgi:anti-sigma regulatory factor (Ser/Thr protein kinase)
MDRKLDLSIWRDMNMVSVVRRFIEELYEQVLDDLDAVSRIALAAHELLENGVKYSKQGNVRIRVTMEDAADGNHVTIQVSNHADPENLAALRAALGEMERATDAMTHYQTLLKRSSKRREGSGLGLARVVAEGEMTLSMQLDDDQVCLRAAVVIDGRAP